jgi:legumain
MRSFTLSCAIALFALQLASAANWAVIIAGSKGYGNYRHQADACHAYQVVKRNGVPESNIVLMMYDDVANAKENPFPGKLFNKPTAAGEEGVDVYKGCKADYTGPKVTGETFLAVLTGDANAAGGKVLQSTSSDKVFVNFADHGGPGSIEMPNGKLLYAKDLMKALTTMHQKKMYERLVFYMEACESGSMFDKLLPSNMSIYATTAANPKESSWGTYCPPHDKVNGKSMNSCLGDLYSVNWMEDSDKAAEQQKETLAEQFELVKKETNKSHVMEFGDTTFKSEKIHDYQGGNSDAATMVQPITPPVDDEAARRLKDISAVRMPDIHLVQKFYAYLRASPRVRDAEAKALIEEIQQREAADQMFAKLAESVTGDASGKVLETHMDITQHKCQQEATDGVMSVCGRFSSYSLQYAKTIVNLCELGHAPTTIVDAARKLC